MVKAFSGPEYLLKTNKAKELYEKFASTLPIYDYHGHLNAREIAENKSFTDLGELWMAGDHYKWRLMRAAGLPEELITGQITTYKEKFMAFAQVLPYFVGNPVYHWAHLELRQYFAIDKPLSAKTADEIYDETLQQIQKGGFRARDLMAKSNVETIATTNDPIDDLYFHRQLHHSTDLQIYVVPTFRPDAVLVIASDSFSTYLQQLAEVSGSNMQTLDDLLDTLRQRMDYFATMGCCSADHSVSTFPTVKGTYAQAKHIFAKRLTGQSLQLEDIERYQYYLLFFLASEYATRGWVMQLHLSALRNANSRLFDQLGADCGVDSIGEAVSIRALQQFFDDLEIIDAVPKVILYTMNPTAYYMMATMAGNFQRGSKGKIQVGPAWWMLDHRDGIVEQLRLISNTGALGLFIGMTTDSRSFLSFSRHDYFRRIVCSLIGQWIEDGEVPDDNETLGPLLEGIFIQNARNYFTN